MDWDTSYLGMGGGVQTYPPDVEDEDILEDLEDGASLSQMFSGPASVRSYQQQSEMMPPTTWKTSPSSTSSQAASRYRARSSRDSISSNNSSASSYSRRYSPSQGSTHWDQWPSRQASATSTPATTEVPPEFPRPPAGLPQMQQLPGRQIPCGLSRHLECNDTFDIQDRDGWIEHAMDHMQDSYPPFSLCPYCNDFKFEPPQLGWSKNEARKHVFMCRMSHIYDDHILNAMRVSEAERPDFHLYRHLEKPTPSAGRATRLPAQPNEGPGFLSAPDIRGVDWKPPKKSQPLVLSKKRDEREYERSLKRRSGRS